MRYSYVESWTVTEKHRLQARKMDQQQTQQGRQPNNAPFEEQHLASNGEVSQSHMTRGEPARRQVYHCANCDIEFFWLPTVVQGKVYCCTGCAAGGPCNCDYSLYRSVTIMGVVHYDQ
jgi:hypothetical protein